MAGNSERRGAVRKVGSKKGPRVGTGGHNRDRLEGRGPTPKAEERTGHPAARRAAAAEKRAATPGRSAPKSPGGRGEGPRSGPPPRRPSRAGTGSEYVAGRNPVVEALRAGVPATAMYLMTRIDTDDRVREALALGADINLPVMEASRIDLDRLTNRAVHQGLALQVPPYEYAHPDDLLRMAPDDVPPLVVALDSVTDPRNLGAVVRSVAAFGGQGVVVPARRSAGMTAGAWKSSAGAVVRAPVARASNLVRALQDYQRAGLLVVGLDAGGEIDLPDLALAYGTASRGVCLVIGAEGDGLGRLIRETCDVIVSIPMSGGNESLNAGVAAGVALYTLRR